MKSLEIIIKEKEKNLDISRMKEINLKGKFDNIINIIEEI